LEYVYINFYLSLLMKDLDVDTKKIRNKMDLMSVKKLIDKNL